MRHPAPNIPNASSRYKYYRQVFSSNSLRSAPLLSYESGYNIRSTLRANWIWKTANDIDHHYWWSKHVSAMAENGKTKPKEPERPGLLVPRSEAEDRIREQIRKGRAIIDEPVSELDQLIRGQEKLEQAKTECSKWSQYNIELLKCLFDTDSIANGYARLDVLLLVNTKRLPDLRKRIEKDIAQLESILERLDLIPESTKVPHAKHNAAAKDNGERWYRNRTIQAALIGLAGLLFVSVVGWLIILYINKPDGRSDPGRNRHTLTERSRDSSPAINTTGPNSPVTLDYNAPGAKQLQGEIPPIISGNEKFIQPEQVEGDVNRPELSPIIKIRETPITPEETTGEVNEPKKAELIKRKEKAIEAEDE